MFNDPPQTGAGKIEAQAAFEAARAKPVAPAKPKSPADGRADALAQGTPPNT